MRLTIEIDAEEEEMLRRYVPLREKIIASDEMRGVVLYDADEESESDALYDDLSDRLVDKVCAVLGHAGWGRVGLRRTRGER